MLSFEDDPPAQSAALGLQLLHSTPSGMTTPAKAPTPDPSSSTPPPQGQRSGTQPPTRVRAEDKRVINADRKSTRLNSSHIQKSRMPSSA